MKKLLALIILSVAIVSCYDGYIYDFTYSAIYFSYQMDVRTVVVGEGMKIEVGAALSGVRANTRDRVVNFTLDPTLINPARLTLMKASSAPYIKNPSTPVVTLLQLPSNYYTLSDPAQMVIKKGWYEGAVVVRPDSINFLKDSVNTINATYALPFRINSVDADSLPYLKKTNVVAVRFENMLWGNYWHGGAALINRPGKADTTIYYRSAVNDIASKIWVLTTVGPCTLYANGYYNQTTTKNEMKLVLKGNKVYMTPGPTASFPYVSDGVGTFNRSKLLQERQIYLKYTFVNAGLTYHCTDTLKFRNRLRDGVNEWQDENPSHYTK